MEEVSFLKSIGYCVHSSLRTIKPLSLQVREETTTSGSELFSPATAHSLTTPLQNSSTSSIAMPTESTVIHRASTTLHARKQLCLSNEYAALELREPATAIASSPELASAKCLPRNTVSVLGTASRTRRIASESSDMAGFEQPTLQTLELAPDSNISSTLLSELHNENWTDVNATATASNDRTHSNTYSSPLVTSPVSVVSDASNSASLSFARKSAVGQLKGPEVSGAAGAYECQSVQLMHHFTPSTRPQLSQFKPLGGQSESLNRISKPDATTSASLLADDDLFIEQSIFSATLFEEDF